MADHSEENETVEEELSESPATQANEISETVVKSWVREAIEDVLSHVPGEGTVAPEADESAPVTLRAIEDASRRAVEEAMLPLREAIEKAAKPRKAVAKKTEPAEPAEEPKAKAEPERAPQGSAGLSKLRAKLWGSDE